MACALESAAWLFGGGGASVSVPTAALPYPPDLVVARFPCDAPLLGALAFATNAARDRLTRRIPAWADS